MNSHSSLPLSPSLPPSLSPHCRGPTKSSPRPGKPKKEKRMWEGGAVSSSEAEALNYSSPPSTASGATNGEIDVSSEWLFSLSLPLSSSLTLTHSLNFSPPLSLSLFHLPHPAFLSPSLSLPLSPSLYLSPSLSLSASLSLSLDVDKG